MRDSKVGEGCYGHAEKAPTISLKIQDAILSVYHACMHMHVHESTIIVMYIHTYAHVKANLRKRL